MEQSTQGVMEPQAATQSPVGEGMLIPVPPSAPTVAFTKVDNNLTGIGFFSASSKRSKKSTKKTTVVIDGGLERRIDILPSAEYGLPITQDQDYWLALMKLVSDQLQREGKITNPFTFTTAELRHILGQSNAGKNYQAVQEWADVMSFTGIKGGAYNTVYKKWLVDRTHVVDRFVTIGKELPDGTTADKNHVWFSQWQLDNINAGNLIPIELTTYTQLQNNIAKNLVPHLQEWLFASQRDGRFEKQYEDICQLLGVRVYHYRSDVERQLRPSLDELVHHGYVSKWAIEPMANRKTYKLVLWHGDKYHRDQQHRIDRRQRAQLSGQAAGENTTPARRPRQRHFNLKPAAPEEPQQQAEPATVIDYRVVAELSKRGVGETDARTILASLPPNQLVLDQLEWADLQIAQSRGKITNPAGFYISLLKQNKSLPANFVSSAARKAQEEANLRKQQAIQKEAEAEQAAQEAAEAEFTLFQTTQPEKYQALYTQAQAQLFAEHPKMAEFASAHQGSSLHDGAIRARIRHLLAQTPEPAPESENSHTPTDQAKPHYATNPAPRQADRLEEISDGQILFAAMLRTVFMTVYLPAPSEPAPAPKSPDDLPK